MHCPTEALGRFLVCDVGVERARLGSDQRGHRVSGRYRIVVGAARARRRG